MQRIQPTGNSTFDTSEQTAYSTFQQAHSAFGGPHKTPAASMYQLEIGYFWSVWTAAMLQVATGGKNAATNATETSNSGDGNGISPILLSGLQNIATGVATIMRAYGQVMPQGVWAITGNTIVGGGTGTWAQGDTVGLTEAAFDTTGLTRPYIYPVSVLQHATFTVATVAAGAIATMTNLAQGVYVGSYPTGTLNLVKITSASGTGTPTCTLTLTFYPTLFNS